MVFPCRISEKSASNVAPETLSRVDGDQAGRLSLSISRALTPSSKSAMVVMCCVGGKGSYGSKQREICVHVNVVEVFYFVGATS